MLQKALQSMLQSGVTKIQSVTLLQSGVTVLQNKMSL